MHVEGPCELTQRQEGEKDLSAAKAVVACNGPACFTASNQRLEKSLCAEPGDPKYTDGGFMAQHLAQKASDQLL